LRAARRGFANHRPCASRCARRREGPAQNNIAAVSAEGRTVCVLILRLNSSCNRSIAFVTGMRIAGADVPLGSKQFRRMVRPSGTEAPGARRCGQAVLGR
jgi:hypothetical protein